MSNPISPNTTIAHYRVVSKPGAGRMGEEYLAHDTKLDRKVVLKILPPQFTADTDRTARFVREARSASALNYFPQLNHRSVDHRLEDRRRRHGEVWRARDPKLGRDVAIKVLPFSFSKCTELNYHSLQVIAQGLRHGTVLPNDPGSRVLTFI